MTNKLTTACLGGGINSAVGNAHRIAIQMDNRWDVVAGCFSTDPIVNQETVRLWNVPRCYDNWEQLLEQEAGKVDAVTILTPTNMHYDMVRKALDLGYAVICEKSLTSTYTETKDLYEIVNQRNLFLTMINNYTGYHMVRELREMVRVGLLGKLINMQVEMPQQGFICQTEDGEVPKPQHWRLQDGPIPTIYLDLAVHLYHIVDFVCSPKPVAITTVHRSNGFFSKVVDDVSCIVQYEGGMSSQIWFSKTALGYKNGLRVRIYGTLGSCEWLQTDPEVLVYTNQIGDTKRIERTSKKTFVASHPRYSRFKAGHPSGFIEALSNYYYDIADALIDYRQNKIFNSEYVVSAKQTERGMAFLNKMVEAATTNTWQTF